MRSLALEQGNLPSCMGRCCEVPPKPPPLWAEQALAPPRRLCALCLCWWPLLESLQFIIKDIGDTGEPKLSGLLWCAPTSTQERGGIAVLDLLVELLMATVQCTACLGKDRVLGL